MASFRAGSFDFILLTTHIRWGSIENKRIGEVWFTGADDAPLLVKYLFTSERLSIQVHPDDDEARARGLQRGKTECWTILDAEPSATLGLGLNAALYRTDVKNEVEQDPVDLKYYQTGRKRVPCL